MPKLKPETQQARREHILDAAERCIANAGFHRTTMQDICRAAAISPGALYVYFDSKEALIAGISERDRQEFAERLEALADAPDFMQALRALGEQYFLEDAAKDHRMSIDIGLESTRNPRVGEIFRRFDRYIVDSFEMLFHKLQREGRIAPALDIPTTVKAFLVVADGMFWRRAVDPAFDAQRVMPAVLKLIETLLNPGH
jgi:TetR/AcrR family transcriptional regulator, repressor for uid operon